MTSKAPDPAHHELLGGTDYRILTRPASAATPLAGFSAATEGSGGGSRLLSAVRAKH